PDGAQRWYCQLRTQTSARTLTHKLTHTRTHAYTNTPQHPHNHQHTHPTQHTHTHTHTHSLQQTVEDNWFCPVPTHQQNLKGTETTQTPALHRSFVITSYYIKDRKR